MEATTHPANDGRLDSHWLGHEGHLYQLDNVDDEMLVEAGKVLKESGYGLMGHITVIGDTHGNVPRRELLIDRPISAEDRKKYEEPFRKVGFSILDLTLH